jgi:hypothetical protein
MRILLHIFLLLKKSTAAANASRSAAPKADDQKLHTASEQPDNGVCDHCGCAASQAASRVGFLGHCSSTSRMPK